MLPFQGANYGIIFHEGRCPALGYFAPLGHSHLRALRAFLPSCPLFERGFSPRLFFLQVKRLRNNTEKALPFPSGGQDSKISFAKLVLRY